MYDHGLILAPSGKCLASLPRAPTQMEPYHKCPAIRKYAKKVSEFSLLPSGFGSDHRRLAQFLEVLPTLEDDNLLPQASHDNAFATLYQFRETPEARNETTVAPDQEDEAGLHALHRKKYSKKSFKHCHEYVSHYASSTPDKAGRILLLHGYPTAQWVGSLGAIHRIDSEMFSHWLDFRSPEDTTLNFTYPPPPAVSWNLIELPIITIGRFNQASVREVSIENLRVSTAQMLKNFHKHLQLDDGLGSKLPVGTPVIRNTLVFDKLHFALEQRILICFVPARTDGWQIIVWTDSNEEADDDLFSDHYGDVFDVDNLIPSIPYRPDMGLKSHLFPKGSAPSKSARKTPFLPHDLGASLHDEVMAKDPFYALTEVFSFAIASENQVLNLIEVKLNEYNSKPFAGDMSTITNLQYLREVLIRHTDLIQNALLSIQTTKESKWPKQTNETAIRWRSTIERNYTYLYDRARTLNTRCQETVAVLMNTIAILESKKAIEEAERVGKLTFLAFIFVPLAFTTSFFSMTFHELQGLSIWTWFVMAGPVLGIALGVFFIDIKKLLRKGRSKVADTQLKLKDMLQR